MFLRLIVNLNCSALSIVNLLKAERKHFVIYAKLCWKGAVKRYFTTLQAVKLFPVISARDKKKRNKCETWAVKTNFRSKLPGFGFPPNIQCREKIGSLLNLT